MVFASPMRVVWLLGQEEEEARGALQTPIHPDREMRNANQIGARCQVTGKKKPDRQGSWFPGSPGDI